MNVLVRNSLALFAAAAVGAVLASYFAPRKVADKARGDSPQGKVRCVVQPLFESTCNPTMCLAMFNDNSFSWAPRNAWWGNYLCLEVTR